MFGYAAIRAIAITTTLIPLTSCSNASEVAATNSAQNAALDNLVGMNGQARTADLKTANTTTIGFKREQTK